MVDIPLQIAIPRPVQIAPGKGITSVTGPNKCLVQYRGTNQEKDKIKKAADMCGLSYGMYMRCIVNDVTAAILSLESE